jgi:hypothetical protein
MRPTNKKVDPILALARTHAGRSGKRRKRPGLLIAIALAIVVGGLALIAWLNRSEPEPVPLMVVATDAVTAAGDSVVLRAWLRPQNGKEEGALLAGQDVYFVDSMLASLDDHKGAGGILEKATTGDDGEATVSWKPPDNPPAVWVRYPGRNPPSYDGPRVFVWPADSKILVVEARHALMAADTRAFRRLQVTQIQSFPGAFQALQQASARGYRIAYLATAPDRPQSYHKLRGWLQRRSPLSPGNFPEGPALGRPSYAGDGEEKGAMRDALRALKRRFKGSLMGVAGRASDGELFQEEGLETYLIAVAAKAPRGVKLLQSWNELGNALP